MATDDDDAATLRERVRELEQTVAQQQDTIQQLMPSRRAILAGGAGLVGGAALTGQASAQSAAGQIGTSSEPVDVEAATVNATDVITDSVNTDDADVDNILGMANANIKPRSITLADDSATSFTAGLGIMLVHQTGANFGARGIFMSGFNDLDSTLLQNMTNQGTGTLSGTTGPDGTHNVAIVGTEFYIENRSGRQETIDIFQFSGGKQQFE